MLLAPQRPPGCRVSRLYSEKFLLLPAVGARVGALDVAAVPEPVLLTGEDLPEIVNAVGLGGAPAGLASPSPWGGVTPVTDQEVSLEGPQGGTAIPQPRPGRSSPRTSKMDPGQTESEQIELEVEFGVG